MKRLFLLPLLFPLAPRAEEASGPALAREWVQLRQTLSAEATEWQTESAHWQTLLELWDVEMDQLETLITEAGQAAVLEEERRSQLEASLAQARKEQATLRQVTARLTPRALTLVTRFPEPLRQELSAPVTELELLETSSREQFRAIVEILTAAGDFHRQATIHTQTIELEGQPLEVDVLYLGLARGWFATADGSQAGLTRPSAEGWSFESQPTLGPRVRQAMAVLKKETRPERIRLPLAIEEVQP
ncbi:MAG: DUF3450 family protein [Verrucomicrobiota bacterium]